MSVIQFLDNGSLSDNRSQLVEMLRILSQQKGEVEATLQEAQLAELVESDSGLRGKLEQIKQPLGAMLREYTSAIKGLIEIAQAYGNIQDAKDVVRKDIQRLQDQRAELAAKEQE
jgi:hypothetical protein